MVFVPLLVLLQEYIWVQLWYRIMLGGNAWGAGPKIFKISSLFKSGFSEASGAV
jgi:hypothetical protein